MILTEEMKENLPLSGLPDDYDGVDEICDQIVNEFNTVCDEIDVFWGGQINNLKTHL